MITDKTECFTKEVRDALGKADVRTIRELRVCVERLTGERDEARQGMAEYKEQYAGIHETKEQALATVRELRRTVKVLEDLAANRNVPSIIHADEV